jgi:hypothetical protein
LIFEDAVTVCTRQFSVWVTSTDLAIIIRELLEAALRLVLITTILAVSVTITVGALHDAASIDTLEHICWAESGFVSSLSDDHSLVPIQISTGHWESLGVSNSERPSSGTITAFFTTIVLDHVVTSRQGQVKIELGVFTVLPSGGSDFSNLLTVNEDVSSSTKVSRGVELEVGVILGDWEGDSVVISKV